MADVLIIGGGITGLATAYELAAGGARVTVIEARRIGAIASTWTLGGVRQSGRDPAELPLAQAAIARWMRLDEELGHPTGYRRKGNLRLARTDDEAAAIHAMVEAQRELGLHLTFLASSSAIRDIAPAFSPSLVAASFCPGDGHADPDLTLAAYASAARRLGVVIREGVAAHRLVTEKGRVIGAETSVGILLADRVVVAAGIHTPALLEPLGIALPLTVKRVCVMRTVAAAPMFEQVFGVANADCAGRQEITGHVRYTTGIGDWPGDPEGWTEANLRPSSDDCSGLKARVGAVIPALASLPVERVWGGLIDLTPDALPVLDAPATHPGLVIGAGFSGHGFGIGPISGVILAALAQDKPSGFDLAPFRLSRLAASGPVVPLTLHG